jgi:hypothetical protein
MSRLKKITAVLALLVLAFVAIAGPAQAAKKKTLKVDISIQAALITQVGNVGTLAGAGTHKIGPYLGQGALTYKRTQVAPDREEPVGTYYTKSGSISGIGAIKFTPQSDPKAPVPYTGTLSITKGTGRFKGASGVLKTYGSATNGTLSQIDIHITGRLKVNRSK